MRNRLISVGIIIIVLCGASFAKTSLSTAARNAVEGGGAESEAAMRLLRSKKQAGLNALFDEFATEIEAFRSGSAASRDWQRIANALDRVAKQKDAYSSRLFWHTDFSEAKKEAGITGKPILSLRLLGGLDEEYSCANSRFFRSILYSDPSIANNLRENYVLHWKSVRPAPKITIDFGDGRTLIRTITGNSIHYIINPRGEIIDAIPGLYSPTVFNRYLTKLSILSKNLDRSALTYANYREATGKALLERWESQMEFLGRENSTTAAGPVTDKDDRVFLSPTAINAAPLAVSKMAVERPVLTRLSRQFEQLRRKTGTEEWLAIARLNGKIELSPESIAMMRTKTRNLSDKEFESLIANTKQYVAIDTAQNEFRFHTALLTWITPSNAANIEGINERVYSELFLTPSSDKWLGMYAPDIYAAIKDNGIQ